MGNGKPNNLATIKMLEEAMKQDKKVGLYNCSLYDTNDGTANVGRKTGIITTDDIANCVVSFDYYLVINLKYSCPRAGVYKIKSNLFETATNMNFDGVDKGIYFPKPYELIIKMVNPNVKKSAKEWKSYLENNNFYAEYEIDLNYQHEDKVIEALPIRFLPLEGELDLYREWRKGLNVNEGGFFDKSLYQFRFGKIHLKPNTTYTFSLSGADNTVTNGITGVQLLSLKGVQAQIIYSGSNIRVSPFTFTTSGEIDGEYLFNVDGTFHDFESYYKPMINEGTHPYPYEDYHGKTMHAIDVPIYFTTDTASPAQTIGGTWEKIGDFTIGSTTVHAWKRL